MIKVQELKGVLDPDKLRLKEALFHFTHIRPRNETGSQFLERHIALRTKL